MTGELWRNNINQLEPYVPGLAIEDVKARYGLQNVIRMASNESPFGPSPKAIDAMREAVRVSHLYPESSNSMLRTKLGEHYGFNPEQIVVSNGADNILLLIAQAYINPGDEVIYCVPTFSVYRTTCLIMDGKPVEVPLTNDYKFDLEAMLNRITEKTKLVYICNPNNPTGTVVDNDAFISFLNKLPKHVIVVLDEAYVEFVDIPDYRTGIDFIQEGYPVISVHTFSKLYGLAAARVGYCMASAEIIKPILAVREPFPVSRMAEAGAVAALEDKEFSSYVLREVSEGMEYLKNELTQLQFEVVDSYANFLLVDYKQEVMPFYKELLKEGIIIRPCTSWGLPNHFRITIGSKEQNKTFINKARKIIKK